MIFYNTIQYCIPFCLMNFTILFGIVRFWMLVTILNNIVHQYCSVLFAVLLYIVLSRLGQNNPATIFVTKSMAGLTNSCDGFAYRIERTEEGGYVLHITNATAILVRRGPAATLRLRMATFG